MKEEDIKKLEKENLSLKKEIDFLKKQVSNPINRGQNQKKGMIQKAINGKVMSRVPFGYKISEKKLVPAENFREVEEIFEEFLREKISLRKLAEKHHLSVNGLKKILTNFTYLGKVKFDGQIYSGNHQPIISSTTFNHVQNKLECLKIKDK